MGPELAKAAGTAGTARRRGKARGEQTEEDLGVPVRPSEGHKPAWLENAEDLGMEPRDQREGKLVRET